MLFLTALNRIAQRKNSKSHVLRFTVFLRTGTDQKMIIFDVLSVFFHFYTDITFDKTPFGFCRVQHHQTADHLKVFIFGTMGANILFTLFQQLFCFSNFRHKILSFDPILSHIEETIQITFRLHRFGLLSFDDISIAYLFPVVNTFSKLFEKNFWPAVRIVRYRRIQTKRKEGREALPFAYLASV